MEKRTVRGISWALLLIVTAGAFACRREDPANQTIHQASAAELPSAVSNSTTSKAAYSEAAFDLSLSARGKLSKGQAGELVIALTAKAPFHVNLEYPHRFKLATKHGLTTPSDTIQRDPAKVGESKLELTIPVTLADAGPFGLEGEMSFSVCTSEKCLMEKRRLVFEASGD